VCLLSRPGVAGMWQRHVWRCGNPVYVVVARVAEGMGGGHENGMGRRCGEAEGRRWRVVVKQCVGMVGMNREGRWWW